MPDIRVAWSFRLYVGMAIDIDTDANLVIDTEIDHT